MGHFPKFELLISQQGRGWPIIIMWPPEIILFYHLIQSFWIYYRKSSGGIRNIWMSLWYLDNEPVSFLSLLTIPNYCQISLEMLNYYNLNSVTTSNFHHLRSNGSTAKTQPFFWSCQPSISGADHSHINLMINLRIDRSSVTHLRLAGNFLQTGPFPTEVTLIPL